MAVNQFCICGNLTRDPELAATSGGTAVLKFGVCVEDSRRKPDGSWESYPNFFDVVVFGGRAQSLSERIHKGDLVTCAGRLHQSRWEAKDGTSRSRVELVANDVATMARKAADRQEGPAGEPDPMEAYADYEQIPLADHDISF